MMPQKQITRSPGECISLTTTANKAVDLGYEGAMFLH
jgi:hypothetical protein